jgi:hypothetical protein
MNDMETPLNHCLRVGSFLSALTFSVSLHAQITAITETGEDTYTLNSVTIDGTEYFESDIVLGQLDSVVPDSSTAAVGSLGVTGVSAFTEGSKANIDAASSSFTYATTALNLQSGSIFQFGTTIGDNDKIFLLEYDAAGFSEEDQILELVDAAGDVIGTYTHTIDISEDFTQLVDWTGTTLYFKRGDSESGGTATSNSLDGVTITLADFGVAEGSVTDATGIRYVNSVNADTTMLGLVQIPEPGSYALMAGAGTLMFVCLRRRRR